jgi:hypothetical protein
LFVRPNCRKVAVVDDVLLWRTSPTSRIVHKMSESQVR